MTILSAYFFLDEKDYVSNLAHKIIPRSFQEKWEILKKSFISAVGGYFKAQLRIETWMYLLLVIGLTILGTKYALLVALGIAFLDLLPVFGTGTVLVPWAIIKVVAGDYKKAVILVVIWLGGQLLRQIIQPKIVSNSIGLQPIPTLFLLFVGWKVDGVIGMILAIPIGLIVYNLHEAGAFNHIYETITILVNDLNAFCKYTAKDREYFKRYGTLEEAELEVPEEIDEKE
jgi:predicted PurR-regulated permease PerM